MLSVRSWMWMLVVSVGTTSAAQAGLLHVGSNAAHGVAANLYNSSHQLVYHEVGGGGGNINPGTTLNGLSLPYLYCLDLPHGISLNTDYTATTVNSTGYIWNNDPLHNSKSVALTNPNGTLSNAGNIAYLMVHYAQAATTTDQQLALQSAIWAQVYGDHYELINNPHLSSAENTLIATTQAWYLSHIPGGGNSGYISDVLWLNPSSDGVHYAQGQVGYIPSSPVPEPSSLASISILLGMVASAWGVRRLRPRTPVSAAA